MIIRYKKGGVKMSQFNGFPPEMIEFMWELRFNNNKEWFDKNRKRYEQFMKKPMDQFAADMCEALKPVFGQEVYYSISRVNRDIRFSRNKAPYRENKWVVYRLRQGRWQDQPSMFFDISPEGWELGVGFYNSKPDFMKAFRKKIDGTPKRFEKIAKDIKKRSEFVLYGEFYKKNMGEMEHSPVVMDWYMRKNVGVIASGEVSEVIYTREIFDIAYEQLAYLVPLNKYLNEITV